MLLIADERGLVIAGIMGAEDAEVGEETEDALIEVANFDGRNILETSQRLGLRTDASSRFERGLDPNMVDYAMDRVTQLLTQNPGAAAPDTLSHYLSSPAVAGHDAPRASPAPARHASRAGGDCGPARIAGFAKWSVKTGCSW